MSEPWWEILHTALKTATELDMEIGIFNSPGWSQSGGPWVKPEESMRYLCSSQVRVEGPSKFSGRLPKPEGMIQDVRVIAYPVPKNDGVLLNDASGTVRSVPALPGIGRLADGDTLTSVRLPVGKTAIVFESPELFTARSITVRSEHRPIVANAVLEALDGSDYRPVAEFDISRFNEMPNVGFDVYAPVTISFPATSSRRSAFRSIMPADPPPCARWNFRQRRGSNVTAKKVWLKCTRLLCRTGRTTFGPLRPKRTILRWRSILPPCGISRSSYPGTEC